MFQISAEHFTNHYRDTQCLATYKESFFYVYKRQVHHMGIAVSVSPEIMIVFID